MTKREVDTGEIVLPLIKTMHVKDSAKGLFKIQKYSHDRIRYNPLLRKEAYGDIKYDEFLVMKPEIIEELMKKA